MDIASSRLLRVVSWNVDQVLSALSNLELSIAVARTTSASGLGAFAVAFLLFGTCLAVTKSVVGQRLQMRLSGASAADCRRGFGIVVSVAALPVGQVDDAPILAELPVRATPATRDGISR